jgi:cell division transport system ATP-binding protein
MKLLEYKGVNICQEGIDVLSDVDFSLERGEFVYLCGKVGSGKSSLLKTLYAELPVKEGEARIFDYNLLKLKSKDRPMLRRKIGIVFQDFQLLNDRSVNDNLEFVLRATGWKSKKEIDDQIDFVLSTVGMAKKGYKWPHQLSGGEQQRIVIARALLNSPELIIADEPTGNLDPQTGRELMELLHGIAQSGTAVIMATHNMQFIEEFPAKCYTCEDGKLKG